jgi:hypothetical protein
MPSTNALKERADHEYTNIWAIRIFVDDRSSAVDFWIYLPFSQRRLALCSLLVQFQLPE